MAEIPWFRHQVSGEPPPPLTARREVRAPSLDEATLRGPDFVPFKVKGSEMIELVLIPADVEQPPRIFTVERGDGPDALATQVDGYVESVKAGPALMIVNEDAKDQSRPVNHRATQLWTRLLGYDPLDALRGDVLVAGPANAAGDLTRCPLQVLQLTGLAP